ncbi:MAG: nucleotide exchange factor GrpE [Thiohalorhabdus sp.]|uniref:nucleotide exchange factor GrpE n=1 Tax=Thiohalorhabdus sp. TaxID=3094134 RepID=UPI0039816010
MTDSSRKNEGEEHFPDQEPEPQEAESSPSEPLPDDPETLKGRVQELEAKVEELEATVADYWNQVLRERAEGENARRRAEKDAEQSRKFALEGFLKELIPVKDSLEMALQVEVEGADSAQKLHKGVSMTLDMLNEVLAKHGIEEVHPVEESFDPNYHQAMSTVETEGEPNQVVSVMQKGYLLNGRLVRPAMVEVSVRPNSAQQGDAGEGGSE